MKFYYFSILVYSKSYCFVKLITWDSWRSKGSAWVGYWIASILLYACIGFVENVRRYPPMQRFPLKDDQVVSSLTFPFSASILPLALLSCTVLKRRGVQLALCFKFSHVILCTLGVNINTLLVSVFPPSLWRSTDSAAAVSYTHLTLPTIYSV